MRLLSMLPSPLMLVYIGQCSNLCQRSYLLVHTDGAPVNDRVCNVSFVVYNRQSAWSRIGRTWCCTSIN